jgi:hypothetical protein
MAVPRPVLLALIGLCVLAAAFLATRNGQDESVTPPPKTEPKQRLEQTHPAKPAAPSANRSQSQGKPAQAAPQPKPAAPKPKPRSNVPPEVARAANALAHDKVVVLFFTKPGAADDTLARGAFQAVDDMKGVAFFKAGVDQLAAYRPMLESPGSPLGISQTPATVIVRPGRKAVLLQGFVDSGTLRQNVADALR